MFIWTANEPTPDVTRAALRKINRTAALLTGLIMIPILATVAKADMIPSIPFVEVNPDPAFLQPIYDWRWISARRDMFPIEDGTMIRDDQFKFFAIWAPMGEVNFVTHCLPLIDGGQKIDQPGPSPNGLNSSAPEPTTMAYLGIGALLVLPRLIWTRRTL